MVVTLLAAIVSIYMLNPEYKRTIKHRNHTVEYGQYLRGKKYLHEGHYIYNTTLVDQAYMKLANRMLDEYLITKDSMLIQEVFRISNDHKLRQDIRNVSLDSLIKHRSALLDTIIYIN